MSAVTMGVLALTVVAIVVWQVIRSRQRWARYNEQWESLQRIAGSDNPRTRRMAAKMALRLIKQGPVPSKKKRRPN